MVLGSGRPFVVKLQNPVKRKKRRINFISEPVSIHNLKIIDDYPKSPLKFSSLISIKISTDSKFESKYLKKLKTLTNIPIFISEKSGKSYEKKIFDLKYRKISDQIILLKIRRAEGGLPIKRFVTGNNVEPNISGIIGMDCLSENFDFLEIFVNDNN